MTEQVHLERGPERHVAGCLVQEPRGRGARVGDDDVHAPERVQREVEARVDLGRVGHVRRERTQRGSSDTAIASFEATGQLGLASLLRASRGDASAHASLVSIGVRDPASLARALVLPVTAPTRAS